MSSSLAAAASRPLLRRLPAAGAAPASRSYVTRAHPKPVTQYPILDAIDQVLAGIEERKLQRVQRWEKYGDRIAAKKGLKVGLCACVC